VFYVIDFPSLFSQNIFRNGFWSVSKIEKNNSSIHQKARR
jgi:hypothetical protein